ncbi:MAG: helix-turn-helix transcriptional regulator [Bdellovibrionales bacterium]|nr:helix-turn-helix transcriptional regulator [Bdellovibrionales bacterium]
MRLKEELRILLKERDLTAAQLARASGVSPKTISDWLAGTPPRNIDQVRKVARVFGVTVDRLCFGETLTEKPSQEATQPTSDLETLLGDGWITGLFEVRLRRVKK